MMNFIQWRIVGATICYLNWLNIITFVLMQPVANASSSRSSSSRVNERGMRRSGTDGRKKFPCFTDRGLHLLLFGLKETKRKGLLYPSCSSFYRRKMLVQRKKREKKRNLLRCRVTHQWHTNSRQVITVGRSVGRSVGWWWCRPQPELIHTTHPRAPPHNQNAADGRVAIYSFVFFQRRKEDQHGAGGRDHVSKLRLIWSAQFNRTV